MGIGLWIKAWEFDLTSEEGLETFSSAWSAVGIAYLFKTNKEIKTRMVFGHWKMKQHSVVLWSLRERTQIRGALWLSELTASRQFPDGRAGRGSKTEFSCLSELRSRSQCLGRPRCLGFMKQSTREEETTEKKKCAVVGLRWAFSWVEILACMGENTLQSEKEPLEKQQILWYQSGPGTVCVPKGQNAETWCYTELWLQSSQLVMP